MINLLPYLIAAGLLVASASCLAKEQVVVPASEPSTTPLSPSPQTNISWPSDPTVYGLHRNEGLKRAWAKFESSQQYRLALPSDRILSPAALARVSSNNPRQAVPFLAWWSVRGLANTDGKDVLVAIVVDPRRSDRTRYGLVVLAAPVSERGAYKVYWVMREEDMESYLLSPASGSIFIECFRPDGSEQTKELAWDKKSKRFRLISHAAPNRK